ncbi:MAG: hypothetical protein OXC55_02320 [Chloroflexi bacterium]|nr:hypothetical protein [Chloroflexota bacterium]
MTAEIIIMNSGAVALAADSALTSSHAGGREKVFASDNKIFELTESAQVAVMNYGAASFMSIPWETVVGEYRRRHGRESFPQLQDYMDAFLRFLKEEMAAEISEEKKEDFLVAAADAVFAWMTRIIDEYLEESTELEGEDNPRVDDLKEKLESERQEVAEEMVNAHYQHIQGLARVSEATEEVVQDAAGILQRVLPDLFEKYELDANSGYAKQLEGIANASIASMTSELAGPEVDISSGIVLAGFGDENLFPGYINVEIEGIYGGMLKWMEREKTQISMPPQASIAGFAQMDTYMLAAGLDIEYFDLIETLVRESLVEYTRRLVGELTGSKGEELERTVEQKGDGIESFVEELTETIDKFLKMDPGGPIDDILEVVSVLPKDQLAEVAGAAISFTSLRRRVSLETETVGGPTDVAVITKNDGLVWVTRKQYFDPGLNPEYLARMSRRGS